MHSGRTTNFVAGGINGEDEGLSNIACISTIENCGWAVKLTRIMMKRIVVCVLKKEGQVRYPQIS